MKRLFLYLLVVNGALLAMEEEKESEATAITRTPSQQECELKNEWNEAMAQFKGSQLDTRYNRYNPLLQVSFFIIQKLNRLHTKNPTLGADWTLNSIYQDLTRVAQDLKEGEVDPIFTNIIEPLISTQIKRMHIPAQPERPIITQGTQSRRTRRRRIIQSTHITQTLVPLQSANPSHANQYENRS